MNLNDNPWPVLTLLVGCISILIATRLKAGPLVSPFSVSMIMLMAIFGVRPLLIADDPEHSFYGRALGEEVWFATVLGFIGVIGLSAGYFFRFLVVSKKPSAKQVQEKASRFEIRLESSAVILIAIGAVLLWGAIMAVRFGGTGVISLMSEGRSSDVSDLLAGLPVAVYALPAAAAFVATYWRITTERNRALVGREKWIFWASMAISIIPPAMLGNRRFILPCIIGAVLAATSRGWNKPVKIRIIIGTFIGFVVLASIPYIRSAGARTGDTSFFGALSEFIQNEGVSGVFTNFFTSYDTEMLDYIAYTIPRLGTDIAWGNGRATIIDIVTSPIPASLMPLPSWSNHVLIETFGASCADGVCPVPSIVGTGYFDFGTAGVLGITFILGLLSRIFEEKFLVTDGYFLVALVIFGSLPATAVRGNLPAQLWIGFNILVAAIVLLKLAGLLISKKKNEGLTPIRPLEVSKR